MEGGKAGMSENTATL